MQITPPFGRLLTAMVTPFKDDLSIDWDNTVVSGSFLTREFANDAFKKFFAYFFEN